MRRYVPPELLPNLKKYRYSSVDKSLVSQYVLQPYWTWLVTLFPMWMAPNLITLLGLLCIGGNVATLLYYTPSLESACPNWVYLSFAVGLWVYQSLDAIDGKQARRTGTSSPLGHLFDHGCDALNTCFGVLLAASALDIGGTWLVPLSFVSSTTLFYLATWEEFHTGTLYLGYINGPVEGVLLAIGVYAWSGLYGAAWWSRTLGSVWQGQARMLPGWLASLRVNQLFAVPCLFFIGSNLVVALNNVAAERRRGAKSMLAPVMGLLPHVILVAAMYAWLLTSPHLLHPYSAVVVLAFGLCTVNMVGRMIVAHVTHDKFPLFNPGLVPLVVGAVHSQLRHHYSTAYTWMSREQEIYFLYATLAFILALHAHFVLDVIDEICAYLHINCLTIADKEKTASSRKKAA